MTTGWRTIGSVLVVMGWTGGALAQTPGAAEAGSGKAAAPEAAPAVPSPPPTAAPAVPPSVPPDVVLLSDGGMVRGTISELNPKGEVVIIMLNGTERRISMEDVEYAGPTSRMPVEDEDDGDEGDRDQNIDEAAQTEAADEGNRTAVKPKVTVRAEEARVELRTEGEEQLTFHLRTSMALAGGAGAGAMARGYDEVCTAPCSANLPAGTHTFALSGARGRPIESEEATRIPAGPSTVIGTLHSERSTRIGGWVILGAGAAAGAGLMVAGATANDCESYASTDCEPVNGTLLALGGGVALASTIIGVVLGTRSDTVQIRVVPGTAGGVRSVSRHTSAADPRLDGHAVPRGLTLVGRF